MASFSIINSSNFPIWLSSEWKLEITVSINYNQVYFFFYSILPCWFLTQQEILKMHVLWNVAHKSLLLVRAAVSLWSTPSWIWWTWGSSLSSLRFRGLPEPLNLQGRKHQENHFLVRVLALPASSLNRTTSKTLCGMSVFRARLLRKKDKCVQQWFPRSL